MKAFYYGVGGLLLLLTALSGCAGSSEYLVEGTPKAVGAKGDLQIEEIDGGNNMVTLKLEHLPRPQQLGEGLESYVAWILPPYRAPINAGTLAFDEDSREGNVMATTPLDNFIFKVTAESNEKATAPSSVVIVEQHVNTD